jgi:hypothetical protein
MNKYIIRYGLVPFNTHGLRTATVEAENEDGARKLLYRALNDPCGDRYAIDRVLPFTEEPEIVGRVISLS